MIELDDEKTRLVLNGRQIILAESDQPVNVGEPLRLCDSRGSLIAVGEVDATRKAVKPLVVFNDQR
jgi:hypothetical protein